MLAADPAQLDASSTADGDVPVESPSFGQMPAELVQLAREVRHRPLPERITAISEALLGRPYLSDPLGEGAGPDPDPFARYDVFDCLTFTEEVLALSLAADPLDAGWVRQSLRYGDETPSYTTRRHFMELQWVPGTIEDGWLRDTTAEYGEVVHQSKEVTATTWKWWGPRRNFVHRDEELPIGRMELDVLPLDVAERVIDQIRPGTVLLTVREDREGVPIWITHVGLVVHKDGVPMMRHSTKMGSSTSRDHTLAWYLDHVRSYKPRKVLGITLLEPVDFGPRLTADVP